jgi:hypothetical protein
MPAMLSSSSAASAPARAGAACQRPGVPPPAAAPLDPACDDGGGGAAGLPGRAAMVAVRLADLASRAGRGLGKDSRTALVAPGAGEIRTGDLVVFLKPVAVPRRWCAATGGCRLPGTRPITPASAWPRTGWMGWPVGQT